MDEEAQPIPLLVPAGGTPPVINSDAGLKTAIKELAAGSGPFAVDAERASGFRYSARAYLIQMFVAMDQCVGEEEVLLKSMQTLARPIAVFRRFLISHTSHRAVRLRALHQGLHM